MTTKQQLAEQEEAVTRLRELVQPGSTVWTTVRHVTRSGMSRSISIYVWQDEGPFDISWLAARALGWKIDQQRGGVKVAGCGMDMGFHLVYSLSRTLYREGFTCLGRAVEQGGRFYECPSNDHSNGDRDYSPHQHSSGGYALRHRWL